MTLPVSGAISIDDILLELGRSTGEQIDLNDVDLLRLAGKTAGQSITFPADFYGKSNGVEVTVTVTIGTNGTDFYYDNSESVGSIDALIINGMIFEEFSYGRPGKGNIFTLQLSGMLDAGDIETLTIDESPADGLIEYSQPAPNNSAGYSDRAFYQPIPAPDTVQEYANGNTVDISFLFTKRVYLGSHLTAATSGTQKGFYEGSYGTISFHKTLEVNALSYTLEALYYDTSTGKLYLRILHNGNAQLTQTFFDRLYARKNWVLFDGAGTPQTLATSSATFSSDATRSVWEWTTTSFFNSGQAVSFSIETPF